MICSNCKNEMRIIEISNRDNFWCELCKYALPVPTPEERRKEVIDQLKTDPNDKIVWTWGHYPNKEQQ